MKDGPIRPYALKAGEGWTYNYGIDFTVKAGERKPGPRLAFVEYTSRAGEEPPDHTHATEDEIFYVLAGDLRFRCGDDTFEATDGGFVFLPRGIEHGYEILVSSTNHDPRKMSHCIRRMLERKVEGVAIMTFGIEEPLLDQLAKRNVPLVFIDIGPKRPGISLLKVDYHHGIRQGVQHLAHPGLAPTDRFTLRHPRRREDLRWHALDFLGTAGVVTGVDHGLLFGHRRLVLFFGHADRPDAAAVEELSHHRLIAG